MITEASPLVPKIVPTEEVKTARGGCCAWLTACFYCFINNANVTNTVQVSTEITLVIAHLHTFVNNQENVIVGVALDTLRDFIDKEIKEGLTDFDVQIDDPKTYADQLSLKLLPQNLDVSDSKSHNEVITNHLAAVKSNLENVLSSKSTAGNNQNP